MKKRKSKGRITSVTDGVSTAYYLNNKKVAEDGDDGFEDLMDALGYEYAIIDEDEWEDNGDGFPDDLDDIRMID